MNASEQPRIAIIGGGVGGTNVARLLVNRLSSVKINLIEKNQAYITPFFTNQHLSGNKKLSDFIQNYHLISQKEQINIINDIAININAEKKYISLGSNEKIAYDKLVVAPGTSLNFTTIDGYDENSALLFPHAYAGSSADQWKILYSQINNMPDGGTVAISVPKRPYRCTPAPYERASFIAAFLKQNKPKSKVLILDSKNEFPLMSLVLQIWQEEYGDLIEWVSADFGGEIIAINNKTKELMSVDEKFSPDVINLIPPQISGKIALDNGLTDNSGWSPVFGNTFESKIAPDIYLLGDTINAGDMPKSASSAQSQAEVVADAIITSLTGHTKKNHTLKNTCYFFTGPNSALMIGGEYQVKEDKIVGSKGFSSDLDSDTNQRFETAKEALHWYRKTTKSMFYQ